MVGVAENLNVCVTLKLRCGLKKTGYLVERRQKQLLSDFFTPLWELYFDRYCIYFIYVQRK